MVGLHACLEFSLYRQCHIERDQGYKFQQEMADVFFDLLARNPLAKRFGVFDSFALANILRAETAVPRVITQRHASGALPTDNQALP